MGVLESRKKARWKGNLSDTGNLWHILEKPVAMAFERGLGLFLPMTAGEDAGMGQTSAFPSDGHMPASRFFG